MQDLAHPEVLAHGVTTVLAVWLGLTVIGRSARLPGARVFALLAGLLAIFAAL
jgi:hypothetical protein